MKYFKTIILCLSAWTIAYNATFAMAAPLAPLTPKLDPTVEMKSRHYRDIVKGVIQNIIEKIMHADEFPIYVPLGETFIACGSDDDAIPLEQNDIVNIIQNLHEIGYVTTIIDNPNNPIDTLVISPAPQVPLPGVTK
jgi:hypothetical protein